MKIIIFVLAIGLLLLFTACSNNTGAADRAGDALDDADKPALSWQTITATEARNMMAEAGSFILLDVRTEEEFRERRIDGALLIPYNEIWDRAETELYDKDAVILLYCRSGRRSALAAAELVALGFTSIYDFGGIIDWPYESVSE